MSRYIAPVPHGLSRGFGGSAMHNGIDYLTPMNTPVYASADGVVAFEGYGKDHSWITWMGGVTILLRHSDSYSGYSHLSRTIVNNGQSVKQGQLLGYSGSTGNSTGPHLHFDMLPLSPNFSNGYAGRVNPASYGLAPYQTPKVTATADQVKKAYTDILERPADAAGLKTYTTNGMTYTQVRADLSNSQEYKNLVARKAAEAKAIADAEAKRIAIEKAAAEAALLAEQKKLEEEKAAQVAAKTSSYTQEDRDRDNAMFTIVQSILSFLKSIFTGGK